MSHQYANDSVPDDWTLAELTLGDYVEPLSLDKLENEDTPLVHVKVSFLTDTSQTVVGIAVARQLGRSLIDE